MSDLLLDTADDAATPVLGVTEAALPGLLEAEGGYAKALADVHDFKARSGQLLLVPRAEGGLARVLFGLGEGGDPAAFRALAAKLPAGDFRLEALAEGVSAEAAALAFALGGYRFDRYRKKREPGGRLHVPGADLAAVRGIAHACALARDMVNTPANDMGPLQIETIAREIAERFSAKIAVVTGDALLEAGYPAVHAVGRAADAARAPRMIELTWGDTSHPAVVIVGKGVVFDTGGLDLKPSAGMRLMKKDMGGAAHALALGRMVMAAGLKVRLSVLVPAVENAISGDAMRPGDVLASRKGLTIEVGNTDAEGRLILADALTRAAELAPVLTIDMATLTGAARIALGPQVIPFYTDDDALAGEIEAASRAAADPLWRMPLWAPYDEALDSDIADVKNDADGWAQAGSITAALFLRRFAPLGSWVHLDIFAWNPKGKPGFPSGGEAQAIRALFQVLTQRYG
jgi:leucyl aminopeptidase